MWGYYIVIDKNIDSGLFLLLEPDVLSRDNHGHNFFEVRHVYDNCNHAKVPGGSN